METAQTPWEVLDDANNWLNESYVVHIHLFHNSIKRIPRVHYASCVTNCEDKTA